MSRDKRFSGVIEPVVVASRLDAVYDYVPSFTVANATDDYDLLTQQATAFNHVKRAWFALIYTDQDITIKFNDEANPAINVNAIDAPMEFRDILAITNIYISNASGSTANVKIMLV